MDFTELIPLIISPVVPFIILALARKIVDSRFLTLLILSFVFGLFAALPMIGLLELANYMDFNRLTSLRRTVFYTVVLLGLSSELVKYLILRFFFYPKKEFNRPFDGILFSLILSMGFATIANIYFYLFWTNVPHISLILYFTPFIHLVCGTMKGFFVGLSKFRIASLVDRVSGLFAGTFFNSLFYFCLVTNDRVLFGLVFGASIILAVILSIKSLNTEKDFGF